MYILLLHYCVQEERTIVVTISDVANTNKMALMQQHQKMEGLTYFYAPSLQAVEFGFFMNRPCKKKKDKIRHMITE